MTDHGVGSWPARRARITPDAVALRQAERALTYAELAGRVDALAAGLADRGVRRGDRVAYLGANDMATFETFFAAGRLGAIFVPLNTRLTAVELGGLLADCAPAALVHGPEAANYKFTSALPAQLLRALAPALQPLINEQIPQTASTSGAAGALKPVVLPAATAPRPEPPAPTAVPANLPAPTGRNPAPRPAGGAPAGAAPVAVEAPAL